MSRMGEGSVALADPSEGALARGEASFRPRGAWTSLLWVGAAEAIRTLVDFSLDRSTVPHVLVIILSWVTPLIVLFIAVRIARGSFVAYCNWQWPRGTAIVLAVVTIVVFETVLRGGLYLMSGSLKNNLPVEGYQAMITPGTWPWWFVLKYWPAAILAPLVEETIYRGFLWRGLAASRLGNAGAWVVAALFFASIHYNYYIQDGHFFPGELISPFVFGLIFGFVRWRTGSTIAAMITHALGNISLSVLTVLAVTQGWP